jgi:hypothetical protein
VFAHVCPRRVRDGCLCPGATAFDSGVGLAILAASIHERRRFDRERVIAIVAKHSHAPAEANASSVAIGIAGSRPVGTIALRECDRRAGGAVRRSRTGEFGRLRKSEADADERRPTAASSIVLAAEQTAASDLAVLLPALSGALVGRGELRVAESKRVFDRTGSDLGWSQPRVPPRSSLMRDCVMLATGG